MGKEKVGIVQALSIALIGALLMTLLSSSQILLSVDNQVADGIYQTPSGGHSEIILINMDEEAVEAYGSMPWSRDIMASAIEVLNENPDKKPAVIGIDTLFIGASDSPENDAYLVEQAGQYDNVVLATTATFDTQYIILEDGSFYTDDYSIIFYEEPYEELLAVTEQGHVNAMIDTDGVLRHAIWQLDLQDGTVIPSFHQTIYQKYMEYIGDDNLLTPTMDSRHRWYVSFQAAPYGFDDGFSLVDLIEGRIDPTIFQDKIVLIGPYTQGMYDEYTTAIDRAMKMHGVEYQANAIASLLNGDLKSEVSLFPQNILVFVLTFLGLLWFYNRKILVSTIGWLVLTASWLGICLLMWKQGYVLCVIYVPLALTISYVVSVAINYARAAWEKHQVTNTFRRYVAPEIVSELLKGDGDVLELGGKLVDIAVLFVDIRGFTTLSEKLSPPEVVDVVNTYLTLTSDCIMKNHGTLDKYVGDCTMAFWGAPLPQEDSVYHAVKAGLDMVEGAKKIKQELLEKYGQEVDFGVGIHYGPAVVGNIGSPMRMDYTAIGDTVNTAARLESVAPPKCLYVSERVIQALEGRIAYHPLEEKISLKGKKEKMQVYSVEGLV